MTDSNLPFNDLEDERNVGRVITRRFTDQLTGSNTLEQLTIAAQAESDEEEELEEHRRLRLLIEGPEESGVSHQDFEVAEIARTELQKVVNKFSEDAKPTRLERIGFKGKSSKTKAGELLAKSAEGDFNDLKASVDNLEEKWKENHGPVYGAFKKLCGTLDDHRTMLTMFPSQNNYASTLCGGLNCLMKAARTHDDIAKMLSNSIADVSDKVATCSDLIGIIRTPRMRKKLAKVYSLMFKFYQKALEWYLQSKLSRAFSSFNENLKQTFDDQMKDLEDSINELYREASLGNTAMVAMIYGEVSKIKAEQRRQRRNYATLDTRAGHRMKRMLEATWMENMALKWKVERLERNRPIVEPESRVQDVTTAGLTHAEAHLRCPPLEPFINGEEGPAFFGTGRFWVAENDVLFKLRAWMSETATSQTLWISSPYEPGVEMSGARAAALAAITAAWQAETPLISYFCKRPQMNEIRAGMSMEQMGLIGLVYSFIHQLLQFSAPEVELAVGKEELTALNGGTESWNVSLKVLGALLDHTPVLMFCVVDGLNDLTWGNGAQWCRQFLEVLFARQRRPETVFNILFTTAGQSQVLPSYVHITDRQMTTKKARELARSGRKVDL